MKNRGNSGEPFRRTLEGAGTLWVAGFVLPVLWIGAALGAGDAAAQQNMGTVGSPALHDASSWPPISPLINRQPDANRLLEDSMKMQDKWKLMAELNARREKDMTSDTAKLLKLARELRSALDQSGKVAPSIDTLRKAEEIEKLAHGVQEKMRATVAN